MMNAVYYSTVLTVESKITTDRNIENIMSSTSAIDRYNSL